MTDIEVQADIDEFGVLVHDRKPYEVVWDAIDENLLPNISRMAEQGADAYNSQRGQRRDSSIIDGTPRLALSTFQAGMQGRLMTPNGDWIAVATPDEDMMDDRVVRMWLSKCNSVIAMLLNRSPFYPQCYTMLGIAGGMGTGTTYRYYDKIQRKEIFSCRNPWEMYYADDPNGDVATAMRLTMMENIQMVQAFPDDTLDPQVIKEANSSEDKHKLVRVLHTVRLNPNYDPTRKDKLSKRYISHYVDLDHEGMIRKGGYNVMPYATWRIEKEVNEAYGRGPGWRALCDIKGLYAYAKTDILAAQFNVNPAIDIPSERKGNVKYVPGGRNYYDELNREIRVINPMSDIKSGLEREAHKQQIIDRHFMVPYFTAMQQVGGMDRERTATEVRQIEQEIAILMGPYAMGFQIQYMDTTVEGLFWDAMENGLIDPPPPQLVQSLNGRKLEVSYSGPLAQAQKAFFNSEPYRKALSDINAVLSVDPTGQHVPYEILDIPDWTRMIQEMMRADGVPEETMKEMKVIQQIRKARDEDMQKRQQMAAIQAAGKAAPGLNQAPQPGSPAEALNKQSSQVAAGK
jgi:hypothetical protein